MTALTFRSDRSLVVVYSFRECAVTACGIASLGPRATSTWSPGLELAPSTKTRGRQIRVKDVRDQGHQSMSGVNDENGKIRSLNRIGPAGQRGSHLIEVGPLAQPGLAK